MSESESENDSDENENNDGSQIEFNLSESGDEGDKSDESDTENIERNTRGISKNYIPMEEFDDYNSALNHVMESNNWTKRYNRDTDEGNKRYFSCKGQHRCPKSLYILLESRSKKCSIWLCDKNHRHPNTSSDIYFFIF